MQPVSRPAVERMHPERFLGISLLGHPDSNLGTTTQTDS
jgi:hypothetical protein